MPNRLQNEKSPYLLQHKDNPVDWYPWCAEAFARARAEDKPVFLSIGYSTCHWCHVMARESFADEEVAQVLNSGFVCVKVDREERPDIDAVYMQVCEAMTGSGGWPLTVVMTPEQKPFFAGTYLPKRSVYGRVGLLDLLAQITSLWEHRREALLASGDKMVGALNAPRTPKDGEPDKALLRRAYESFRQRYDPRWGGFGAAPKFPSPHNLLFLMRYGAREQLPDALEMVERTLLAMADGGLFDHIGGGFARYSTDARWYQPHFEKMLYDNALLLLAYLEAYQRTGKPRYAGVARRTADYVLREMTAPEGGFYSAQDADSEGVEGKYYLFTAEELRSALGARDGAAFCRLYGIPDNGRGGIPNRIGIKEPGWAAEDARLEALRDYRAARTRLHCDDKILLTWNAWMILALARAGCVLGEPRYLAAAQTAQRFLEEHLTDAENRLYVRWRDGAAAHAGQLDDYAVCALALLELYRATFDVAYLERAMLRAGQMRRLFADETQGGFYRTASDAEALIARPKELFDGAMPSGNSCAAMVLQELADLTGEPDWRAAADRQHRFLAGQAARYPSGFSYALLAMERALYPHRELVVCSAQVPPELTEYLRRRPANALSVLLKSDETAARLAACAPFTADYPVPPRGAMWYLCENGRCAMPTDDFQKLDL